MKKVIWIVLDSVGMGALPDAKLFNDAGANTIAHTWQYNNGLDIPNLLKLGYGNIDGMDVLPDCEKPLAAYARAMELSNGKDTTVGHWEMAGIISEKAFPTYPEGFPEPVIDEFIKKTGVKGVLGNCVASGTEIIKELGTLQKKTGKPIVYTSADSVFQIAAYVGKDDSPNETDEVKLNELYRQCKIARSILTGEHEVARVIARPFVGCEGNYTRTSDRRDFAILPPENNLLFCLKKQGFDVVGIGKIEDIFAGSGITEAIHTKDNEDGMDVTINYVQKDYNGLIFTNLVEFDSKWGHRRDAKGYGEGLEAFDKRLAELMAVMNEEDILIINADHGCDPVFKGTDHTREYVPVLIYGKNINPVNLGTIESFADIGSTVADYLGANRLANGKSFLDRIMR